MAEAIAPQQLEKEPDRPYQAFRHWLDNPGATLGAVAIAFGVNEPTVRQWASRFRWRDRKEEVLLGPRPKEDPATLAVRTVIESLSAVDASELTMMDRTRLLDLAEKLAARPVAMERQDWAIAMRVDLDRALFSDLEPLHSRSMDFRRLSSQEREVAAWIFDRAAGLSTPWRQAHEVGPESAEEPSPPFDQILDRNDEPKE